MIEQSFDSLSEEFQTSARRYRKNDEDVTLSMLLTKYSVLLRHTLDDATEKDKVAEALFGCGTDILDSIISRKTSFFGDYREQVSRIFSALLTPESRDHIPTQAADILAGAALALVRECESIEQSDFQGAGAYSNWKEFKNDGNQLAETVLSFADKFREALDDSNANIKTRVSVTPSRQLTLKGPASASA